MFAFPYFYALPHEAGAAVSGHRRIAKP